MNVSSKLKLEDAVARTLFEPFEHAPGHCRAAVLVTCHGLPLQIGGTIARAFAARRPERVATLIVVG